MKSKTHKNRANKLLPYEKDNSADDDVSDQPTNTVNDLVDNCDTGRSTKKYKRKACSSSQQREHGLEQFEPKIQKHKSNKKSGGKEMYFDSAKEIKKEMSVESDGETSKQDNTPESLGKKNKLKKKKKKNKTNQISLQPNTATLDYLRKWKNERSHWKFEKVKQIRLVSNMFDNEKLPDEYFPTFLEYMEGASKSMKEFMTKVANTVVDEMEKWEGLSDSDKETTPKVDENKYKRARSLLQMLQ